MKQALEAWLYNAKNAYNWADKLGDYDWVKEEAKRNAEALKAKLKE